jgi:carboxyl-terminal processing protease
MKKNIRFSIIAISAAILFLAFTSRDGKYFEISKNIEIFTNVYKELNTWYVDDLDPATVMREGIDAMVKNMDPYTNYFSESQIEGYRYESEGKYEGIGAGVKLIDGFPTITEPYENSPATKAGLKAGDQIIEINGESAEGRTKGEVNSVVRGVPGTTVQFKVRRPGESTDRNVTLTRGILQMPNVPYSGFVADGIGYITLTTFTPDAGRNVAKALRDLKTENPDIRGVIFDLRGNGGGLLREAVNVSNVFIPKGEEVVSTRGKVPERDQSYSTKMAPVDQNIPLVILINKNSASASEIVSGVIQDLDRGVMVGQRSYGKGLVQNTRDVGYNAKLKMTTAKYYIPSGRCIQSVEYENGEPKHIPDSERAQFHTRNGRMVLDGGGVKPDVVVELEPPSELLKALREQDIIFKYVTEYCSQYDSIQSIEKFSFDAYDDFTKFVAKSDFEYATNAETALNELTGMVFDRKLEKELQSELSAISKALEADKKDHLKRYRDEIVNEIEMDIVGRYLFENGKTRQKLKNDPELKEPIAILNDESRYADLLK